MTAVNPRFVLVLQCADRRGIVAAVTTCLAEAGHSIIEAHQYQDPGSGRFFMRALFQPDGGGTTDVVSLNELFESTALRFGMTFRFVDCSRKPRVLIAVSKFGHCLHDLMHRWRAGLLPIDIPAVMSNHDDMRSFTEWNGVAFHHLPLSPGDKAAQEARVMELVDELRIDLVVLARYMQILSPRLCAFLEGRCINIHHSFLPSFKGAKPYHQAHERGVKIIGATAHYVTTDLDEGPIIEQDIQRVSHARTPEQLVAIGRDVECKVLSRAVAWHVDHRVMLNGHRTIVFD